MKRMQSAAAAMVVLGIWAVPAFPADSDPGTYPERLTFEPRTGEWVQVASPVPGTEDGDLELARAMLARGKAKKASKQLKKWLEMYPDSPRYPEGLFYLADADFQRGHYYKAYERYEELMDSYAGSELVERALRREMAIAGKFLAGTRRRVMGVRMLPATEEGLNILDNIAVDRAAGTALAAEALKMRGDHFYQQGEFADAEREYARLAREFPSGAEAPLAMLRSAQSAMASFGGVAFDDAPLIEAEIRFQEVLRRYPKLAEQQQVPQILEQIRDTRAEKEYRIARWYDRTKRYRAAGFYYKSVAHHWPDTHWAGLAEQAASKLPPEAEAPAEGSGEIPQAPTIPLGLPVQ